MRIRLACLSSIVAISIVTLTVMLHPLYVNASVSLVDAKDIQETGNLSRSDELPRSLTASDWVTVTGTLKQLSLGCDYSRSYWGRGSLSVWGVNANSQIYQRTGDVWTLIAGNLSQISVGQEIWGVNSKNQIFRRVGDTWQQVDGTLKQIAVGCDGEVWGIAPDNKIQHRNGSGWEEIAGSLQQISVGNAENIWGTDANNQIFQRQNETWVQIAGTLKDVEVDQKGEVWGINPEGKVFRRARDRWLEQTGAMSQLAITSDSESVEVWAVDTQEQIYETYSGHLMAGYAYHDANQNKQQDKDEPGIPGFTVQWVVLTKPLNIPNVYTLGVSGEDGFFSCERRVLQGFPAASYYNFVPPSSYPFITQSGPDYGLFEGVKTWLPIIRR